MNRIVPVLVLLWSGLASGTSDSPSAEQVGEEQRIDITIRNYEFQLSQPTAVRRGLPVIIILRNQDIVKHGFTSPMLFGVFLQGEGEGIAAYGKGVDGFYVDPGKTLVIRFIPERPGSFTFKCDLHPQMKGELFLLQIPTA
ncbi:MAG: hypothetical protein C4534_05705 [Gaiellales bacterium]|nr:MAG: hypothetical protein C4534_05705 [Gaiellales bacterium]